MIGSHAIKFSHGSQTQDEVGQNYLFEECTLKSCIGGRLPKITLSGKSPQENGLFVSLLNISSTP